MPNRLIKCYYYHQYLLLHNRITIVKVTSKPPNNDDCENDNKNCNCDVYDFDVCATCVDTSQIYKTQVNFGNLSLKQHPLCFIVLSDKNYTNSIETSILKYCRFFNFLFKINNINMLMYKSDI